jgi:phosphate transport system permease protein
MGRDRLPARLTTPADNAARAVEGLQRPRGRGIKERLFEGSLLFATVIGLIVLGALLVDVTADGFARLDGSFFTSFRSRRPQDAGILAGLSGTLTIMVYVALLTFPLGVAAAVYLEEYAPRNRFTRFMEANISNLAGVPSVVYGLLGVAIFVYYLEMGRSLLAAACTLSLLVLPVVIVAGREALRAVPQSIRDGALALGATPLQVTTRQVLPAALPGILTGTILALSRAIGETAPLLVVGALFGRRATSSPLDPLDSFTALPIEILNFVRLPQEGFQTNASAGIVVLMVVLLGMNSAAILLRNRYARRW